MKTFFAIARTGLDAAVRHPLRSAAAAVCVVAVLVPFVVGSAIARGLADQAEDAVRYGADLHVSGERLGRPVPVPAAAADLVRAVPGVTEVVPRIVAALRLGANRESAVLVGLPADRFPSNAIACVEGTLPSAGHRNELAVGSQLAKRLDLSVGSVIPPFYRNEAGEHISHVVGIFRSELPVWEANLVLTDIGTAARICDARGIVSGFLVSCPPAYQEAVSVKILEIESLAPGDPQGPIRPRVTTREAAAALIPAGVLHREGVFNLHFVLAFAVGIPLVLVTSGVGLAERRRETGLLKALGWHTDEILLRGIAESLFLAVAGASVAVLLAFAWLALGNGYGVAGVFLSGADTAPGFDVPYRLLPEPVLVGTLLSLVVTSTGTLLSTWRAATAPPMEAMQ